MTTTTTTMLRWTALPVLLLSTLGDAVQIWSSPGALPTSIPASCRAALSQNITCSGGLITGQFLGAGRFPDNATLTSYCQSSCLSSLQTFQKNVDLRCGTTLYQMHANGSLQTGPSIADPLVWAYNTSCLQDQGQFCLPAIRNNSVTACSNCALKYGAAMLSNDFGRQRFQPGPFSSALSSCNVPASSFTYTYTPSTTTGTPAASATPTCTGSSYTVQNGDTCQSVSQSKSIAIDRLIAANGLDYNCSTLTTGSSLCLGPSCALQTVQSNQSCADIANGKGFSVIQLTTWNPTIHTNCDNLDGMIGRSICVSPPGTTSYSESNLNISSSTTITPMFTGPWVTGTAITNPPSTSTSWFNTQTNWSSTQSTTTFVYNSTRASLLNDITTLCPIQPSDVANGWTVGDLPDACEDLLDPYCYPDLNQPPPTSTYFPAVCSPAFYNNASSTSASAGGAPTPLEPDTISSCKQYHQVLDGDTCGSISSHFGITLDNFYTWNPHVGTSCTSLWVGYYVCVGV